MKTSLGFTAWFLVIAAAASAQNVVDSIPNGWTIGGYGEIYYLYDFNNPSNHNLPFSYSHNRIEEVAVNLVLIKADYSTKRVRAHLGLATGTFMHANYAAENDVLKNIYEANMGVKISRSRKLWIDAGILPSHIGFESAIGKDNWTLTRSLSAENSPYFETGVRLAYTSHNDQWYLALLYLNGWQRIERADANHTPAVGGQVTFHPSSGITLNYSNFIGSERPDSARQMRYFQEVYGFFRSARHWQFIAGFDFGIEQQHKNSHQYNIWYAPVGIVRFLPFKKTAIVARAEYYHDKKSVIVLTDSPKGFVVLGLSANIDYQISDQVLWRLEVRTLSGEQPVFTGKSDDLDQQETFVSMAMAISF